MFILKPFGSMQIRQSIGTTHKIGNLEFTSWNDQLQKLQAEKNAPVDFKALWKMAGLTGYKNYRQN